MRAETITYQAGEQTCQAYVAYEEAGEQKKPVVLVAHAWRGQDDFARKKAEKLASLGYVGFAADLYGDGKNAGNNDEAFQLMAPLFKDRKTLRERIKGAYDAATQHPCVDASRIGAIGFCFGGLTVIELLRSGAELSGIVSFHGILGNKLGDMEAESPPNAPMKGAALLLNGHLDPMVPNENIVKVQQEFVDAGIDWQFHNYGQAYHAFTNPIAKSPEEGMVYNATADRRSWQMMCNFFEEIF